LRAYRNISFGGRGADVDADEAAGDRACGSPAFLPESSAVVDLAVIQGFLGATDTFVYHEFFLRLTKQPTARREQLLHGVRDALYAALYLQLGFFSVSGAAAVAVLALLAAEVAVTLTDFLEEDATRRLPRGERIMHSVIAILYGAFLANYVPVLIVAAGDPSGISAGVHALTPLFGVMSLGAALMAVRDLAAYVRLGAK
jgi:hypothetical protein